MNQNVRFVFSLAVLAALLVAGCFNEATLPDGSGGTGANGPGVCNKDVGDQCFGEGAECGDLVCHCGGWMHEDDPDLDDACGGPPPNPCVAGMACTGEGASCDGLTCHCGMWMSPQYVGGITCGSGGNGSGGSTGTGGSGATTYNVTFEVTGNAYHIWCEGGFVEAYAPDVPDDQVTWYGPWHSFGNDTFGPQMPPGQHPGNEWLTHSVTVTVQSNASLRAQCYLNTNGAETSGDLIRYAFADPTQLQSGESVKVFHSKYGQVYPPQGQHAYLTQNLDPQGFSENLQVDP